MPGNETLFSNYPIVPYANTNVINIMDRTAILNNVFRNPFLFYPFDITNNIRPDQLANSYYNDNYLDWLVYMSNQIVDPYYGWYLTVDQFNDFLTLKYGSVQNALLKTKYYRNNWYADETQISVSAYHALDFALLKYYQPVYGVGSQPIFYTRTQADWSITTNEVVVYNFFYEYPTLIKDEIVTISIDPQTNGQGQVLFSNSTCLILQHLTGVFQPDANDNYSSLTYFQSTESNVLLTFQSQDDITSNSVSALLPQEQVFYSPVTYYDFENEKNEQNKTIRLLNSSFVPQVTAQMKKLLNG